MSDRYSFPPRWRAVVAATWLLSPAFGCSSAERAGQEETRANRSAIENGSPLLEGDELLRYVVRFHPYVDGPRAGLCTGTLVGPQTVITAGHCVVCTRASDSWVMLGSSQNEDADRTQLPISEREAATDRYYLSSARLHSVLDGVEYDCSDPRHPSPGVVRNYDLAVLHLRRPVPGGMGLPPNQVLTTLPYVSFPLLGHETIEVGAGYTSGAGIHADLGVLRKTNATVSNMGIVGPDVNCGPTGTSFVLAMTPPVLWGGDSGGPTFIQQDGRMLLVGVHSSSVVTDSESAPTYTTANGQFLRPEIGLWRIHYTDDDCDAIADNVDNCPGQSNPKQQDTNQNLMGDDCDTCGFANLYDTTNSNIIAESTASAQPLADVCDPVAHERPERVVPGSSSNKARLVQGDGVGPDDTIEISSSTFVGRVYENAPVGIRLGSGTSTYRWCNCVDTYANNLPLPLSGCVNKWDGALCSSRNPIASLRWRSMSLTPTSFSTPAPDSAGNMAREFWVGQSASAGTWTWHWYEDLSTAGVPLLLDTETSRLVYAWGALLAHVNDPPRPPYASPRDGQYALRDVYRLAPTGPVVPEPIPPRVPEACNLPQCFHWLDPIAQCIMCNDPASKIDTVVDPAALRSDQGRVYAVRVDGRATDITPEVPSELQILLSDTNRISIGPSEPGRWRAARQARYELVSVPRTFAAGNTPAILMTKSQQERASCGATGGAAAACETLRLTGFAAGDGQAGASSQTPARAGVPASIHGPKIAFSALQGSMFLLDAANAAGGIERVWRYDMGPGDWTQVELQGRLPGEGVTSVAYDPFASRLLFVEVQARPGRVRLGSINVRTGHVVELASWPRLGVFDDLSVHIGADRSLVLVGTRTNAYAAWRFVVSGEHLRLTGALVGIGTPLDRAFMGERDLVLAVRTGEKGKLVALDAKAFKGCPLDLRRIEL